VQDYCEIMNNIKDLELTENQDVELLAREGRKAISEARQDIFVCCPRKAQNASPPSKRGVAEYRHNVTGGRQPNSKKFRFWNNECELRGNEVTLVRNKTNPRSFVEFHPVELLFLAA
jgi:hypothetical protein